MYDLSLRVEGQWAEASADALAGILTEAFGQAPQRTWLERPALGVPELGDGVAIATLVLTIPGALVATLDLAQRLKLQERLEKLIELARRERQERNTAVYLMRPDPGWLEVDRARPADLLDAVQPESHRDE